MKKTVGTEAMDKSLIEKVSRILYSCGAISFGHFTLTSGAYSPYYIDMRLIPSYPDQFNELCGFYVELIKSKVKEFNRVAGVPTAGIPYAVMVAHKLRKPFLYVREALKHHGRGRIIEGIIKPGDKVLVVDDIATTGGSILKAVESLRMSGGSVSDSVVLIDREQGASELLIREGVRLHSVATITEIAKALYDLGLLEKEKLELIVKYIEAGGFIKDR
ncbi:MAG: orotate phosphoribosyltransferase [Candidatus Nezhaarchaeales archaeon]